MNWIITTAVSEHAISLATVTEVVTGATIEAEIGAATEVETETGVVTEAVIEAETGVGTGVVIGVVTGAGKEAGIEVVTVIDIQGGHDEEVSRALGRLDHHGHIGQKPGQDRDLAQGLIAVSDQRVHWGTVLDSGPLPDWEAPGDVLDRPYAHDQGLDPTLFRGDILVEVLSTAPNARETTRRRTERRLLITSANGLGQEADLLQGTDRGLNRIILHLLLVPTRYTRSRTPRIEARRRIRRQYLPHQQRKLPRIRHLAKRGNQSLLLLRRRQRRLFLLLLLLLKRPRLPRKAFPARTRTNLPRFAR